MTRRPRTAGSSTEATVAHVLVSRHADHLPLYRRAQIMAIAAGDPTA